MFLENDTVFYSNNGICQIKDICEMTVANVTKKYYVLRPVNALNSTIYIPCDSDVLISQMKKLITKEEAKVMISQLPQQKSIWIEDRHVRKEKFKDILKNGDFLDVAVMLKSIYLKKQELVSKKKKLPAADDAIYREGEKTMIETLSYILDMEKNEIIPYILAQEP